MPYIPVKHMGVRSNGLQRYSGKMYFNCDDDFTNVYICQSYQLEHFKYQVYLNKAV